MGAVEGRMNHPLQPAKISVALCTYNGEPFIEKQLASIAQQTRPPEELVVCDDRSTDQTLAIVRAFAANASFPVVVIQNSETLGSTRNFEQAIRLCTGDLIALSDQDDLWFPGRLERSEQEFAAHADAGLVFTDAQLIDEHDQPLDQTLWQRLGFSGERKQALLAGQFIVLAKHRFVTGATVMFRAGLRDRCLPVPAGWIHDEWIAMVIAAFAALRPIDETLIRYRIHGTQQVGLHNKLQQRAQGNTRAEKHWARVAESVNELQQLCDALVVMGVGEGSEVLSAYRQHLQFLQFRAALPASRLQRTAPILTRPGQYKQHASGLPSMLKDLLLPAPHGT
jgi:glycosyltransferase involved in cell wall biosynthesis